MPVRRLACLMTAGVVALVGATAACSSEPERSVANYCSQVETLRTIDEDLAAGDPVRIQARADDLRLLQQVAPAEIEPSVIILLGITDEFARTAGTATDRSEVADIVFRGRSADIASIEAAGLAVTDYTSRNCRVDLGGSTPRSGSTPTVPGTGADPSTTTTAPIGSPTSPTSPTGPTTTGPTTTTTSTPSLLVD